MALDVKAKETDRLAREVAALTGEPLRRTRAADLAARFRAIGEHCAGPPDLDTRNPDEIAGYDEHGVWS
jgi:antitoxin VapB